MMTISDEIFHGLLLSLAGFLFAMALTPFYTHFAYKYKFWKKQKTTTVDGKELPVTDIIPTTMTKEGDQMVINLKGGADSKKFTIEMTNAFMANFGDPTKVYNILTKTVVVDNYTPNGV